MRNIKKVEKSELIPLLIKYKKIFGYVFPIQKVKYLSNEIVIERLKICIDNKKLYEDQIFVSNECEKKVESDLKMIFNLVKLSMKEINYDYKKNIEELMNVYKLRCNGKTFEFSEHLKSLIISLLSNNRWGDSNIKNNINKINSIFHNFDRNYLKIVDSNIIISELKKIHCTNPMIKKQILAIPYNIDILEKIELDYGSLDNYIVTTLPNNIVNSFNEEKYKLKQVGHAVTFDYLKRVGINTCKTTTQMEKLFGSKKLSIVKKEKATSGEVKNIIKKISKLSNVTEFEVESIFQQFCLSRFSNICTERPNCEKCKLRNICNFNKLIN